MSNNNKILVYIASPYAVVPQGGHITPDEIKSIVLKRYELVSKVTADVIDNCPHIIPFSPIAYTHPLMEYVKSVVDWIELDIELLRRCDWLLKLELPGWELSKGMKKETAEADRLGMPILYAKPTEIIGLLKYNYDRYLEYGAI